MIAKKTFRNANFFSVEKILRMFSSSSFFASVQASHERNERIKSQARRRRTTNSTRWKARKNLIKMFCAYINYQSAELFRVFFLKRWWMCRPCRCLLTSAALHGLLETRDTVDGVLYCDTKWISLSCIFKLQFRLIFSLSMTRFSFQFQFSLHSQRQASNFFLLYLIVTQLILPTTATSESGWGPQHKFSI